VHVQGGSYHGLHVRDYPACLDTDNSEILWFEPGRAELIRVYAFKSEACRGHNLFRLREYDLAHVYLSGELFDAIERAGLKGLKPTKVWEG
jgi:hypothetical protein